MAAKSASQVRRHPLRGLTTCGLGPTRTCLYTHPHAVSDTAATHHKLLFARSYPLCTSPVTAVLTRCKVLLLLLLLLLLMVVLEVGRCCIQPYTAR